MANAEKTLRVVIREEEYWTSLGTLRGKPQEWRASRTHEHIGGLHGWKARTMLALERVLLSLPD